MWMRALPLLLLAATLPASSAASQPLPVHVGGRAVREADGGWRFGWPGVYFESRFSGESVSVAAAPGADRLRLSIDGAVRADLIGPGEVSVSIDGLAPGEHVARLDKVTESQEGSARFLGFGAGPGSGRKALDDTCVNASALAAHSLIARGRARSTASTPLSEMYQRLPVRLTTSPRTAPAIASVLGSTAPCRPTR